MYTKKQYSHEDFIYAYPFSPNGKGIDIKSAYEPTYLFIYGNEIDLIFLVDFKFKENLFTLTIYDANYCPICCTENNRVDSENKIYMHFSEEESKLYFPSGTYHCSLLTSDSYILIAANQCMIKVV